VIVRQSPACTWLGTLDASQELSALSLGNIQIQLGPANASPGDELNPASQTTAAGQREHRKVRELVISDIVAYNQCPRRSQLYAEMCAKAAKEEQEYAQEANTAALLYWRRIILWQIRTEEEGAKRLCSDLAAQLVGEDKLLGSLYQPSRVTEGVAESMARLKAGIVTADTNMRNAMRSQNPQEEHNAVSQVNSEDTQATAVTSTSEALQSPKTSTTFADAPLSITLRGLPYANPASSSSGNKTSTRPTDPRKA